MRQFEESKRKSFFIDELRKVYRFLKERFIFFRVVFFWVHPHTWKRIGHYIALKWSFGVNSAALRRHLKRHAGKQNIRKVIAVSLIEHLGDIVSCEPVVRDFRQKCPEAFIVFALHHAYRELMDSHPEVDFVLPVTCVSEWALFANSKYFDKIIDLNLEERKCSICNKPWHKQGGNRGVTFSSYYNIGSLIEAFCMSAGLEAPADGPRIFINEKDTLFINQFHLPKLFIAVHAESNMSERELPEAIWNRVIAHINQHWKVPIVEIGLKSKALFTEDTSNRSLCGQLSIMQSAEVIRRSALFLSVDSGPAHLANAVGAYGIIVLGHYKNFRRYIPYSGDYAHGIRCELLHHDGPVAEIPVTRIMEAIDRRLSAVMSAGLKSS